MEQTIIPAPQPITDEELQGSLAAQIDSASGHTSDPLSTKRAELFSVYSRTGYTDDEIARREDRSDVVDSTASDNVDTILGELLEMLMGAETIASFTPSGPNDEAAARQETAAVHHIFFGQNPGYLSLQSWLWDGLTLINGYVKAWYDERIEVQTETYTGQSEDSIAAVIADLEADGAHVEVVFHEIETTETEIRPELLRSAYHLQQEAEEADEVTQSPETGGIILTNRTHAYRLKIRRKKGSYRIEPVATDELLVSSRWDSVDLKGCPFVGHRYRTTEGDLISRGFDTDQVRMLPTSEDTEFGFERTTRFDGYGLSQDDAPAVDQSSRSIMVTECWVYADRDGDGIPELIMATVGGADGELLRYADGSVAVQEVEEIPIHAWTPFIIPHRHHGESVVERSAPIQRTKTVFQRMLSDTTAFSANPRMVLGKGAVGPDTIADSQIYRPGGLIRANDATQVVPMKLPSSVGDILPVIDYWSDQNEQRTGATRLNQGLVSDKFGKQVAGVTIAQLRQAGAAKINMIARNFLETGFASLMRHLHALIRRHQDKEMSFRLRDEWVEVDPRAWGPRSDVQVSIGLGTQGRMVKTEVLREIVDKQTAAIQAGSVLADEQKMFNALSDFALVNGFRNPDRYFNNPEAVPPQPEEEEETEATPEQLLAQSQIEVGRMEADTRRQAVIQKETNDARNAKLKNRELDLKQTELKLKDDRERDEMVLDAIKAIGARLTAIEARQIAAPPTDTALLAESE